MGGNKLLKTDKQIRKQIITNEILRLRDSEGKLPNDVFKVLENTYIRNGGKNDIFRKHRTTRRDEIRETLIELGYEL